MSKATAYAEHLAPLNASARTDFLNTHSGLPRPRGNLELLWGFARVAEHDHVQQLIPAQDEYLRSAAALGLGRLALETSSSDYLEQLTALAADHSWRVREAVAMAAQLIGDSDGEQFRALVSRWAESPDPLVQRAAVAGVCEPRLLKDPASARLAVQLCSRVTSAYAQHSREERRDDTQRALRKGLGYCWSVAIAALPAEGFALFDKLDTSDPDIAWIVKHNLSKKRLLGLR